MMSRNIRLHFSLGILMMAALGFIGCKPSGTGQPSPTPSPRPNAMAGAPVSRGITGHTEDQHGQQYDDDYPNCFRQDDRRNLILVVTAPEITQDNVTMLLYNPNLSEPVKPSAPPTIQPGSWAKFTFSDKGDRTPDTNIQHLGPGPYDGQAAITTTDPRTNRLISIVLHYPYDTYVHDATDCFDKLKPGASRRHLVK